MLHERGALTGVYVEQSLRAVPLRKADAVMPMACAMRTVAGICAMLKTPRWSSMSWLEVMVIMNDGANSES